MPPMKYCEIIADKLHAAGWSWGAVRSQGMVGDVGVDAAQGYLAEADCDGPQLREISINL